MTSKFSRSMALALLILTAGLASCAKKPDGCKEHTGDGLCADAGKDPLGKPLGNAATTP